MGCISSKPLTSSPARYHSDSNRSGAASEQHASVQGRHTGLSGPQSPQLSYREQCLVGVARWPDPQYNRENTASQMEYGHSFWKASRDIGHEIASGKINTFDELWDKAREWRVAASGGDYDTFGDDRYPTRNFTSTTPLANQYEFIKDRFIHAEGGELSENMDGSFSREFPLRENLGGEPIILSTVVMSTNADANRNDEQYVKARRFESGEPFYIRHTYSSEIGVIMEHVESLYNKALDPHLSNTEFMENIAETHWWMANAMPDQRGSAAKTELCVRAMAQARGIDLPPMKHGVLADLEAMTTPREDFVRNYGNMFDSRN